MLYKDGVYVWDTDDFTLERSSLEAIDVMRELGYVITVLNNSSIQGYYKFGGILVYINDIRSMRVYTDFNKVCNIKFNMMTDCLYGSNNTVLLKLCDDFVFATTKILPVLEGVAILITDIDGSMKCIRITWESIFNNPADYDYSFSKILKEVVL